jgi:hypothetical protein
MADAASGSAIVAIRNVQSIVTARRDPCRNAG